MRRKGQLGGASDCEHWQPLEPPDALASDDASAVAAASPGAPVPPLLPLPPLDPPLDAPLDPPLEDALLASGLVTVASGEDPASLSSTPASTGLVAIPVAPQNTR